MFTMVVISIATVIILDMNLYVVAVSTFMIVLWLPGILAGPGRGSEHGEALSAESADGG